MSYIWIYRFLGGGINPPLPTSETVFNVLHKEVWHLNVPSVLVYLQGLPTTTVSPHYGLRCPLHTTTTPYPTSLPTA